MTKRRIKNNKKRTLLKFGFFFYLGFCLFAIVWLRAAVVNLEYELGDLDQLKEALRSEQKMVVAQRASIYSTEKIEKIAVKRLGMTLPERENVYYVKRTSAAGPIKASME